MDVGWLRGTFQRFFGAPPVAKPTSPAKSEIDRIRDGELEVAGRRQSDERAPHLGGHAPKAGVLAARLEQLREQDPKPVRPKPEDYPSAATFDAAYMAYQDAQMALLHKKFPHAIAGGELWHGTDLPPEQVLAKGIPMKGAGDNFDVAQHQLDLNAHDTPEGSALRGACMSAMVPGGMADEGGYVYLLVPRGGGVMVNAALMNEDKLPGEQEIAIGARQPGCQIKGYCKVGEWSDTFQARRLGPFIPNPAFDPQA